MKEGAVEDKDISSGWRNSLAIVELCVLFLTMFLFFFVLKNCS